MLEYNACGVLRALVDGIKCIILRAYVIDGKTSFIVRITTKKQIKYKEGQILRVDESRLTNRENIKAFPGFWLQCMRRAK